MDAKEYLSHIREIDREIKTKRETLSILEAQTEKCTSVLSDMPFGEHDNRGKEKAYVRKMDAEQYIKDRVIYLESLRNNAILMIEQIEDGIIRDLLTKRYIHNKSWVIMAKELRFNTESHCHWVHRKGLKAMNEIMKEEE